MDFYTQTVSSLLFPFHERLKQHDTVKIRKEMEKTQWYRPEEIKKLQLERLKMFLTDVGQNVSYYQQQFKMQGFSPESITSLDDLRQLSLTDKPFIRKHADQLKANDAYGLARLNTGSSGEPLIFFIGKKRISHDVAAKWGATRWWNVDIGDPEVVIWGSPIELGAQDKIRLFRDKLLRTKLLPPCEMSVEKVNGFIRQIQNMLLFGYPSALAHIATQAKKNKPKAGSSRH
ncbi:capsular polysaccharide biosynthesis protein CapK, partial [Methylotuvimicrobium alcaliphilum]|uniref:Capsular polysaccharide biosynthesis protein CapK n=1 Tax=Methylotuvimicrobium alcaliphilum (strain DSM 19304 / NCIMB 14124 / VKM B-2133 / 20Z) TaxID=1091494 RepID=G4SYV8_META2